MREMTPWPLFWRVVLAISLIAGPVAPVTAAPHVAKVAPAAMTDAIPCHGDVAPPPPADDAPCDDGCCPQPDCDPGACRVAGPLIAAFAPRLAAPAPLAPDVTAQAGTPPDFASPPLLRPPIA